MIVRVYERARKAKLVSRVIVATDDDRIANAVRSVGGEARLTSLEHRSGTERVAEVAASLDSDIIVNVQGDEPCIDPSTIDAAIEPLLEDACVEMATTSEPVESVDDVLNPNLVKVVTDGQSFALYFSRQPIPCPREQVRRAGSLADALQHDPSLLALYRKHTGLYVYRRATLLKLANLPPSPLERIEQLEQLRALEHGVRIKVVRVTSRSIGVDTLDDLERVRKLFVEGKADG
jgi:3-deoxy-manno-octulosonate cytidylyltransferase (CMP-KDO synthetase)